MFLCSEQFPMYQIYPQDNAQFEVLWLENDILSLSASQKTTGSLLCLVISMTFAPTMSLLSATWLRSILNPLITIMFSRKFLFLAHGTYRLFKPLFRLFQQTTIQYYVLCRFPRKKKSFLFQRPTWKLPPNVLQTSSWCELKVSVQINGSQRSSVSTKFYHVFRISHLLSNSLSDCRWSRSDLRYPCRQTANKTAKQTITQTKCI